ncbi:hypothetical protein F5B22DRAFT_528753 [Xylaria bambusicola]|uniref:uncharacterized protein n=1 Tax=Xylaria bambusicola TaxID=326684 RepID=UPI0020073CAD|nr:uncharacterized protein F5B22DRAFT_528753 [Xylaria bambusicola]KAI0505339.1 hypothetical protein F5B22DRAFT_528753 [Xylaria bambusicola]
MATHVKLTVTHYRLPQHTHEDFMRWIIDDHLPLLMPILKRNGFVSYSLFDTPASMNEQLKASMAGGHREKWQYADFDCFIEYVFTDVKNIEGMLADPDWAKSVEHEPDWVDTSKALMSIGYITPYLMENGDVVNVPKLK